MFQTYAYQVLEDRAGCRLYYEFYRREKQLQFIKVYEQWEMYYKGILIAYIIPGEVQLAYFCEDEIMIRAAFDLMRHAILEIMVSDEAYQIVDSIEALS